jgi:hypothetical protein
MEHIYANVALPKFVDEKGQVVPVNHQKITQDIFAALKKAENPDRLLSLNLADKVIQRLIVCKGFDTLLNIEQIDDMIEFVLFESANYRAAKEFHMSRIGSTPVNDRITFNMG